ncbi:MAG: glycogen debranching enzyme, partial [Acidimicrobiales bacterium]
PNVLKLVMDSLRYWVTEMHVDGFRFDLASALAREDHAVDRLSGFFDLIHQDPVVNRVKLIAEPWDVGDGGYQVGNFPPLWSEWNGKYRDKVRDYWRGTPGSLGKFASRFSGSADLYYGSGRETTASINFITAHDGFTLADLVSYNHKKNEANAEQNRDGEAHNRSWNSGAEGETTDPTVLTVRKTRQRSLLATMLLSQGVPMLLGGDEFGRSQGGNNNAYCQDNHISWFDWNTIDTELLEFTKKLIRFRADHPVFRRRQWFSGSTINDTNLPDINWFTTDGYAMNDGDWHSSRGEFTAFLNGDGMVSTGPRGEQISDETFLVMFNPQPEARTFTIPQLLSDNEPVQKAAEQPSNTESLAANRSTAKTGELPASSASPPARRTTTKSAAQEVSPAEAQKLSQQSTQEASQEPSLWRVAIDTDPTKTRDLLLAEGETIGLSPWSMVVLERQLDEASELNITTARR